MRALGLLGALGATAGLVALAALALGGAETAGTRYGAERQTLLVAAVLGRLAAALVVRALRPDVPCVARALALAVAAVPLAVPAVWVAAHEPLPSAADTTGCGSLTNPVTTGDPRAQVACDAALGTQRTAAGVLGLLPLGSLLGAVVVCARRPQDP